MEREDWVREEVMRRMQIAIRYGQKVFEETWGCRYLWWLAGGLGWERIQGAYEHETRLDSYQREEGPQMDELPLSGLLAPVGMSPASWFESWSWLLLMTDRL